MTELINDVLDWAKDRQLLDKSSSEKQYIKLTEEVGEIGRAILKDDLAGFVDGIGDVLVVLIILAKQNNFDIEFCLQMAYDEIKDRKGKTVNGTFIKD